jgi:hypothetical protein
MPKGPCKTALRQLLDLGYVVLLEGEGDSYEVNVLYSDRVRESVDAHGITPELACMAALQSVRAIRGEINNGRSEKKKLPRRTI